MPPRLNPFQGVTFSSVAPLFVVLKKVHLLPLIEGGRGGWAPVVLSPVEGRSSLIVPVRRGINETKTRMRNDIPSTGVKEKPLHAGQACMDRGEVYLLTRSLLMGDPLASDPADPFLLSVLALSESGPGREGTDIFFNCWPHVPFGNFQIIAGLQVHPEFGGCLKIF